MPTFNVGASMNLFDKHGGHSKLRLKYAQLIATAEGQADLKQSLWNQLEAKLTALAFEAVFEDGDV